MTHGVIANPEGVKQSSISFICKEFLDRRGAHAPRDDAPNRSISTHFGISR